MLQSYKERDSVATSALTKARALSFGIPKGSNAESLPVGLISLFNLF